MRKLTEEELEREISRFKEYATEAGIQDFFDYESDQFKNAVCGLSNDTGCAYPGSFIVHVNYLIALARRMANTISGTFKIDQQSLTKCCMLQHYSKLLMFEPNDNQWEIEKRGLVNKFTQLDGRLKGGTRSLVCAMNANIPITPVEAEAILSIDREEDSGKLFDNIMTIIIRQANELAYAIEKEKYGKL